MLDQILSKDATTFLTKYYTKNLIASIVYIVAILANLFLYLKIEKLYIFFILLALILFLNVKFKQRMAVKLKNVLDKECDPVKFRDIMCGFLIKCKKNKARQRYYMNIAHANYYLMDKESMKKALDLIDINGLSTEDKICFMYRSLCYARLINDSQRFWKMDEDFRAFGKSKMSVSDQKYYLRIEKSVEILRCIMGGDEKEIIEICAENASRTRSLAVRVNLEYEMAYLYMKNKQFEEAKKHVFFVVENGNTTEYAQICRKKYLKKIVK